MPNALTYSGWPLTTALGAHAEGQAGSVHSQAHRLVERTDQRGKSVAVGPHRKQLILPGSAELVSAAFLRAKHQILQGRVE